MNPDILAKTIKECQKGQSDAFAELLREFGPQLYAFFVRNTGSHPDAEDLLQDLFVKLLVKIRSYKHDNRFKSWLFMVAANLLRDWFRKRAHLPASLDATQDSEHSSEWLAFPDNNNQPDRQALRHEQADKLQKALHQLPPQDRNIILLRHYGGLSFQEIASQLDIPLGTALAKVHRSLKKLRRLMTENEK